MTIDEIAKKLCEYSYLKLCEQCAKGANPSYSLETYWEINKKYFTGRAEIYLEVKECLKAK
jgi:hypothetical protein